MNFLLYLDPCAHAAQYNSKHESQKCHIISYIKWNCVETSILCDRILRTHKMFELQADISLKVETNFITLTQLLVDMEVSKTSSNIKTTTPALFASPWQAFFLAQCFSWEHIERCELWRSSTFHCTLRLYREKIEKYMRR